MKIKISGITYEVNFVPTAEMQGCIGLADFNKQLITIDENATPQTKRIALMHELIHIMDKTYNIKLTEDQVVVLTHAIIALADDNDNLVFHD